MVCFRSQSDAFKKMLAVILENPTAEPFFFCNAYGGLVEGVLNYGSALANSCQQFSAQTETLNNIEVFPNQLTNDYQYYFGPLGVPYYNYIMGCKTLF